MQLNIQLALKEGAQLLDFLNVVVFLQLSEPEGLSLDHQWRYILRRGSVIVYWK